MCSMVKEDYLMTLSTFVMSVVFGVFAGWLAGIAAHS